MNILLNFFPVQSGGGQQVAMNFLSQIAVNSYGHQWYVYVGENSELHKLAVQKIHPDSIMSIPYSYKARIIHRRKLGDFIDSKNIDIIYNYAPILPLRKNIPQVVRSVYSNLYFPEIDFWGEYSFLTRLKKKAIDVLRLKGTLAASGLIFENKSMQERAVSLFNYPCSNTMYIHPSVTKFDESNINPDYQFLEEDNSFKILYLSSWHLNKNIHILPYVALLLKEENIHLKFILSLDAEASDVEKTLLSKINGLEVSEYFELIGKVPAQFVHQVVKISNAMILLSKLECFSSNIIESYYFGKPLLISDEPWSRSECEDSVLYANRSDAQDIATKIKYLLHDQSLYTKLVEKGSVKLKNYNSPSEKVKRQIEFLELIYNKHIH